MKVEYTDVKRFLVSTGVVAIGLAFLIPWLIFRESYAYDISKAQIGELSVLGKLIIYSHQLFGLILGFISICLTPILLILGAILITFGIRKWWEMQSIYDRKEIALMGQEEVKLRQMTIDEIEKQREVEVQQDQQIEELQPIFQRNMLDKYSEIEKLVEKRLIDCLPSHLGVLISNRRLGNVYYDMIFQYNNASSFDIIIEIKYASKGYRGGWVIETVTRVLYSMDIYMRYKRKNARAVVLFISPQVPPSSTSYLDSILYDDRFRDKVLVRFISEHDIRTFECRKFLDLLSVEL